jgi:hypothetical protein
VAGARWVQSEILAKNSSARLKVYAIWFKMFPGDARSEWPAALLTDPRVVHLWDEQKIVGTWFGKHPDYLNSDKVLWDAFLIYKAESNWTDKPSHFVGMGRTIVAKREDLRKYLQPLLTQ